MREDPKHHAARLLHDAGRGLGGGWGELFVCEAAKLERINADRNY
jgi:hypothetical protein